LSRGGLNGLGLSPDEKLLHVVNLGVWNINADGTPGTRPTWRPGRRHRDPADRVTNTGTNSLAADGKTSSPSAAAPR
jgi:hypothetical protein